MLCTYAYTQTLTVKFTGRDQTGQHYVKLDHVKTFNLDQLWEEVLYFPDTTLVLGGVGIIDYGNPSNSQLEQNVPNPFNGTTHFALYLREGADALLEVFDLMGKTITSQYYANLSAGAHLFSANLTNPQVYILKVTVKNEQMHLKMVNEGFGTENSINYVSVAAQSNDFDYEAKNGQALGIYPFHNGDELQHTGYTVINGVEYKSETITQRQNESETLILPFYLTPTVITDEVSNITSSSAVCGGSVSYTGEATIINRGICWSTSPNPTINDNSTFDGNGIGSFTSNIIGLTPGTTYYVRAYATSSANITGYGEQVTFNTLATIPSVTTSMVSNITDNSATCGGNVVHNGGAAVTSRGVCWSTSQNPTIGDNHTTDGSGTGAFISTLTNLIPGTTYFVRAYATNSVGTAYGEVFTFTTTYVDAQPCPNMPTLTDYDGNMYNTVQIGSQCWMKENLRTTHNADGTSIPLGYDTSYTIAYRYYPNNDPSTVNTFGYLYNYSALTHAASCSNSNPSGVQGICPNGWHVPSYSEWTQLNNYVSSQSEYLCGSNASYIAKALASTTDWQSSNVNCSIGNNLNLNNATGFSALPAGGRVAYIFGYGSHAVFWSISENTEFSNIVIYLRNDFKNIATGGYGTMWCGHSVRCIRNESENSEILPTIVTNPATSITSVSAFVSGNITSEGSSLVTDRGFCWNTSPNPTINNSYSANGNGGLGVYTCYITGLLSGTTYYVRAYATNNQGISYGNEIRFITQGTNPNDGQPCPTTNTLTDIDGNIYNTVQLGNQCWMKENLRTTRYANGTTIPLGNSTSTNTAYRYYPNNDSSTVNTYGYLYNWKALMDTAFSSNTNPSGVQGICPIGWHVPSHSEWILLTDYISNHIYYHCDNNNSFIAKSLASTIEWANSTTNCSIGNVLGSNNASGFSALPSGGVDMVFRYGADFWSSTDMSENAAYTGLELRSGSATINWHSHISKSYKLSVRCVKN